ncbi:MAG: glutamyl-tRNA reductase [Terriglobales bacterium]
MSLHLLGISHHTAPLEQREPLAISAGALPRALALLGEVPEVTEGLILSTCNRVEALVAAGEGAAPDLHAFFAQAAPAASMPPPSSWYRLQDADAMRHLFRVAASLDSLVVGEPQILGQLKQAFTAAQTAGVLGPELDSLGQRAFRAAKRVRTETAIAAQPVSVSQAAVDLARQIFGDLAGKTILLLGTGLMGTAALRYLRAQGATRVLVFNRTFAHARELAEKCGGEAHPLEQLAEMGALADIILACTGSPQPIIRRADAAHFLARRHGRPVLFLDLAVPRDIEPSVHQLDNAFVYNVDDLDQVVSANLHGRRQEAVQGEKIIEEEVCAYLERRQLLDVVPTLRALQARAEALRASEWERAQSRLGPLSSEQKQAMEALTVSLMHKWLHEPMVQLKEASRNGDGGRAALLDLAQRLFGLTLAEALESEAAPDVLGATAGARPGSRS